MPFRQYPSPPHPPHCSIVPPYLLEALASSDDPHVAAHAQATLDVDAELRQSRRTSGLRADRASTPRRRRLAPGTTAGPVRAIHDAEHGTTLPGTLVRSEGDPATGDRAVTEAYDGLGSTWQLWQEAYGRNSLDGKGLPLVASVHFGTNYDNAFWDGTQMVFGDGDGVIFLPFTRSVDVIGHELAHGVTQYTSGLNYQDQSGALNESVSDVFGVLVKQRLLGHSADQADWLVGAELLAPGVNGVALRSMAAPGTALRRPAPGQGPPARPPARLRRHHRRQRRGAHQLGHPQQGVPRLATTLGGNAWEVAGQVWVDTITGDISADCDFATFARLTVAAATARHGADSEVVTAVRAGWDAVGVTTGATAPSGPGTSTPAGVRRGVGVGFGLGRDAGPGHPGQRPPHRRVRRAHRRAHRRAGRAAQRRRPGLALPAGRRRAARAGRRGRRPTTDARHVLLRRALRDAAARPRAARARAHRRRALAARAHPGHRPTAERPGPRIGAMTEPDPRELTRADFDAVRPVPTRWSDNDMFGHLNNAVYLELFDSVLNAWMQAETGIDENVAPTLGVVAETSCRYYREVSFPVTVDVGVRANRLGRTSVLFEFGVFLPDDERIAAHGLWAQVYVDRETRRPVPMPDAVRTHLEGAVSGRVGSEP